MTTTLDAIWNHAERVHQETSKGIGAPLIQLPMDKVSVGTMDGEPALFMTMTDLIELTGSILNIPLKTAMSKTDDQ